MKMFIAISAEDIVISKFVKYLVSRGQTLFTRRGAIACSISAPHEKGLVRFTGLTGTETIIVVMVVN